MCDGFSFDMYTLTLYHVQNEIKNWIFFSDFNELVISGATLQIPINYVKWIRTND